ncbi:hypothetical protein HDU98_002925 [Podochytrium sp. JEL0797]|nr:hypothetical protein HDU98_002925 [Podochytrium sp. JEL0797]
MKVLLITTLASTALAQSCSFGAYQCSGSTTLQQCSYGTGNVLSWANVQTCSTGTVCSTSGYIGCVAGSAPATTAGPAPATTATSAAAKPTTTAAAPVTTAPAPATTAAASAGSGTPCAAPFVSGTAYNGGAQVSFNNVNYVAKWWESGTVTPDQAGDGGWSSQGACGSAPAKTSATTTPVVATTATTAAVVPTTSAAVVPTTAAATSAAATTAAIKTSPAVTSAAPATSATTAAAPATTTAAATTGPACYPNYTATPFAGITYKSGDQVSYNGQNWVVTYQGAAGPPNAGAGTGWTLQGPCSGNGFTFRPFTTPGVIGYWTQWSPYSRKQNSIDQIDLSGFTGINYAFVNVDATGTLQTFDSNADLNWMRTFTAQRVKYPNLKAIVSIGGWSGSQHFSTVAASASLTQAFVKNVHTFLDTMGFDGVDLDWEYPGGSGISCNAVSTSDAANLVNLVSALRTELGPTRSISLAVSAETSHYADPATGVSYIPQIMKYVNYAQLMSYDFYGSWDAYSDFNSPLNAPGPSDPQQPSQNNVGYPVPLSQAAAVALWTKAGALPSQLTNGLAFYGRSWSVPSTTNNGLYQLCQGSTQDPKTGLYSACTGPVGDFLDITQWCDPCKTCYNSGVWMYLNMRGAAGQQSPPLPSSATAAGNGWTRQYFDFAQSPTVQTASNYRGVPSFISYDDPVSIKAKAAWAKSSGLGGTMIWELSQDYNAELVTAVRAGWGA